MTVAPSEPRRFLEILERIPYQERPERYEYHLTRKGRDLHVALVGLRQWGDDYCSEKPPMLARTKSDKKPVIAALVPKRSDHLHLEEVEFVQIGRASCRERG